MSSRRPKATPDLRQLLVVNQLLTRAALMGARGLDHPQRDLDKECGYPHNPTAQLYRQYYEQEGVARRANDVYPDECWSVYPEVYETDETTTTPFEEAWNELVEEHNLYHHLHRLDRLAGLGRFGGMLLGLNDLRNGDDLTKPVTYSPDNKLLFLRPMDESLVWVAEYETDLASPRVGLPTYYTVKLVDPNSLPNLAETGEERLADVKVHWSRFFHFADNLDSSPAFGTPRLRPVINRLFDIRKVLGGSAEMFWKGAFPGYSFEALPDLVESAEMDEDSVKEQVEDYFNGLKRYMALTGVHANSLAPQVADPTNHLTQQLLALCASLGVPLRIFLGSESGHLASTQDTATWHGRVMRRNLTIINPLMLKPLARHLAMVGVVPKPERVRVSWKDLNALTDQERADVALKKAQALLQYVTSGAEAVMPVKFFYTTILGMTPEEVKPLVRAARRQTNRLTPDPRSGAAGRNTPGGQDTNPQDNTGASGRRNALGR